MPGACLLDHAIIASTAGFVSFENMKARTATQRFRYLASAQAAHGVGKKLRKLFQTTPTQFSALKRTRIVGVRNGQLPKIGAFHQRRVQAVGRGFDLAPLVSFRSTRHSPQNMAEGSE